MAKIDIAACPPRVGSGYPLPFRLEAATREKRALGDAAGLNAFGVNLTRLPPGGVSSQRHWHSHEDEFVWVLSGDLVLVTDAGETAMGAGDCAGFKAGVPDGHRLENRSDADAIYLEVGARRSEDTCTYPDIDLHAPAGRGGYTHKDGTPYLPD